MNLARTGLLIAAMTALFLTAGWLVGGQGGLVVALLLAGAMNLFAFWGSDQMVLRMHQAHPVDPSDAPELHGLVRQLAARAGLPMPAVYLIESDQPNAFATGRDPEHSAVAVTRGLVQTLRRDELAGVIAHELAHIKNRDTLTMTVAATIAGAIGFLANFAFFFGGSQDSRNNPLGMLGTILVMILAPMAAMLVQMAISRTREYSADRLGAEICGDPLSLASALRSIEQDGGRHLMASAEHNPASAHLFIINPLHGGALAGLFRTHPPTEERVRRLLDHARELGGSVPSSSRPADPSSLQVSGRSARPSGVWGSRPAGSAAVGSSQEGRPSGSFSRPQRHPWGRSGTSPRRGGSVPPTGRR